MKKAHIRTFTGNIRDTYKWGFSNTCMTWQMINNTHTHTCFSPEDHLRTSHASLWTIVSRVIRRPWTSHVIHFGESLDYITKKFSRRKLSEVQLLRPSQMAAGPARGLDSMENTCRHVCFLNIWIWGTHMSESCSFLLRTQIVIITPDFRVDKKRLAKWLKIQDIPAI